MKDFTIAVCVVAIAGFVMQYKIRPTWFEKVVFHSIVGRTYWVVYAGIVFVRTCCALRPARAVAKGFKAASVHVQNHPVLVIGL